MVSIDRAAAQILLNMYDDIQDLDARMSCSSEGFRRHFMVLTRTPPARDAVAQLRRAIDAARDAQDAEED